MKISLSKEKLVFHFRMWALPMVLIVVYMLQLKFPAIHEHGALWSEHPRWWQHFTCNFMSASPLHLAMNASGLVIVYSQFAPQVRAPLLALAFFFFAALSTWIFQALWMPQHAWMIGASGGSYTLLGFFSWFLRRAKFCLFKKTSRFDFPILPVLIVFIVGEFFYARWRMPQLAWQLHASGFGLGIGMAMAAHAIYAACRMGINKRPAQGFLHGFCSLVYEGIDRVKEFSEISGKTGIAEEAV